MILHNGLKISKEGFRSVDPATGKLDVEVWTKGRVNTKTGKYVKPVLIEEDSLVSFKDMPLEAYFFMDEHDLRMVEKYRNGNTR